MRPQSFTIINVFDWFLKAFIFILPIAYLPGISQYGLQSLIFNYGAIAMLSLSFFIDHKRRSDNILLPVVLLISALVSIIKIPTAFSIHLFQMIFAVVLYKSIVECVDGVNKVSNWFIYGCLVNMVFVAIQLSGFEPIYVIIPGVGWHDTLLSHGGLMGRNYHISFFVAMCLPLAFHKHKLLGILLLALVIVQKSFAGYLAASVGLVLFYVKDFKASYRNLIGLLVLTPICGFVSMNYNFNKLLLRVLTWKVVAKDILVNPFIGYGLGSFDQLFLGRVANEATNPYTVVMSSYNEFIRGVAEIGLLPASICFIVLIKLLASWYREARKDELAKALFCGVMALLAISMFHEIIRFTRIIIPLIIMGALCEARIKQVKTKEIEDGQVESKS